MSHNDDTYSREYNRHREPCNLYRDLNRESRQHDYKHESAHQNLPTPARVRGEGGGDDEEPAGSLSDVEADIMNMDPHMAGLVYHTGSCQGRGRTAPLYHGRVGEFSCPCCTRPVSCPACLQWMTAPGPTGSPGPNGQQQRELNAFDLATNVPGSDMQPPRRRWGRRNANANTNINMEDRDPRNANANTGMIGESVFSQSTIGESSVSPPTGPTVNAFGDEIPTAEEMARMHEEGLRLLGEKPGPPTPKEYPSPRSDYPSEDDAWRYFTQAHLTPRNNNTDIEDSEVSETVHLQQDEDQQHRPQQRVDDGQVDQRWVVVAGGVIANVRRIERYYRQAQMRRLHDEWVYMKNFYQDAFPELPIDADVLLSMIDGPSSSRVL